jgi:hypothetical protein
MSYPNKCFNCETTENLNDYWPDDQPKAVLLCEDCMAEQQRIERLANDLAKLPSCDYRLMLMDKAETVQQLVNVLRAHDMTSCASCVAAQYGEAA